LLIVIVLIIFDKYDEKGAGCYGTKTRVFWQAVMADLTGEQYKVLLRLLSSEVGGEIVVKQNELAGDLEMTESNVSRSAKELSFSGLKVCSNGEMMAQDCARLEAFWPWLKT
jgi:DNA-binding MarR family transcriptional regulator